MQKIRKFQRAARSLGLVNTMHWMVQRLRMRRSRPKELFTLRSKHAKFPLWCRSHSSDAYVFHQIFVMREYSCLDDIIDPRLIIDCGANVGYSSAYFLSRFDRARVIAVEPCPENFKILEMNARPYGDRITCIQSAVWNDATGLVLESGYRDGREWARTVREPLSSEKPSVTTVDIDTLLQSSGQREIDILKVDIEGAEKIVFSKNHEEWIKNVKNIVIELHDDECNSIFYKAISDIPFRISRSCELTVCKRMDAAGWDSETADELSSNKVQA